MAPDEGRIFDFSGSVSAAKFLATRGFTLPAFQPSVKFRAVLFRNLESGWIPELEIGIKTRQKSSENRENTEKV